MSYEFSFGWFFIGVLIIVFGAAFLRWHRVIADNMGSGVVSYERYKFWALITLGVGLVVMVNLHTLILVTFFRMIFPNLG